MYIAGYLLFVLFFSVVLIECAIFQVSDGRSVIAYGIRDHIGIDLNRFLLRTVCVAVIKRVTVVGIVDPVREEQQGTVFAEAACIAENICAGRKIVVIKAAVVGKPGRDLPGIFIGKVGIIKLFVLDIHSIIPGGPACISSQKYKNAYKGGSDNDTGTCKYKSLFGIFLPVFFLLFFSGRFFCVIVFLFVLFLSGFGVVYQRRAAAFTESGIGMRGTAALRAEERIVDRR